MRFIRLYVKLSTARHHHLELDAVSNSATYCAGVADVAGPQGLLYEGSKERRGWLELDALEL